MSAFDIEVDILLSDVAQRYGHEQSIDHNEFNLAILMTIVMNLTYLE